MILSYLTLLNNAKADIDQSAKMLHSLLNKIWNEEEIPNEWKEGILIRIPKTEGLSKCENWRPITLLCATSEIMTEILLDRLKP